MTPYAHLVELARTAHVPRAWPRSDGTIVFELRDADGRLRAGRIEDGGPTVGSYGTDRKLPALADLAAQGEVLVHRLNRRAVVRLGDRIVKVVRPGRAGDVAAASRRFGAACVAAGLGAAPVLTVGDDRVETGLLAGRTLHDVGDAGQAGWERFAARWPHVARGPSVDLAAWDARAEAAGLTTWFGHVARFRSVRDPGRLGRAVDGAVTELVEGAPDPDVVLHRDLHDKQLLWDGTRLAVLDLDTAARGEAAVDLANLAVHVELRAAQGLLSGGAAATIGALLGRLADELPVSPARLAAYARATRLRLACLYSFRPTAAPWLPAWLDRVAPPVLH